LDYKLNDSINKEEKRDSSSSPRPQVSEWRLFPASFRLVKGSNGSNLKKKNINSLFQINKFINL